MWLQVCIVFLLVMLAMDYYYASTACSGPSDKTGYCSLWGSSEGPIGDLNLAWRYRTQDVYLRYTLADMATLCLALLVPFIAPRRWIGIVGMLAIGFGALYGLPYVWLVYR